MSVENDEMKSAAMEYVSLWPLVMSRFIEMTL